MELKKTKIPEAAMTSGSADSPVIICDSAINKIEADNHEIPGKELRMDFYQKLSYVENLFSWPD